MEEIIIFPLYSVLKAEIEQLRTELCLLLTRYDELRFFECKNIEMIYTLKLGTYEYKAYESQCKFSLLMQKIDLIQAQKEKMQKIDIEDINRKLDIEWKKYQMELDEKLRKIQEYTEYKNNRPNKIISVIEKKEIKRLYFTILKNLHPDLYPETNMENLYLFTQAISAYKESNLESLRMIAEITSNSLFVKSAHEVVINMIKERKRLTDLIERTNEQIFSIKSSYPYRLKRFIGDKSKIAQSRIRLENIRCRYESLIVEYQQRIKNLLEM